MSADEPHYEPHYEPDTTSPRGLALFTLGLFAMIGISLLAVWLVFLIARTRPRSAVRYQEALPSAAGPARVWIDEAGARQSWETQERRRLDGYRWIDRKRGVVQLPIHRAMQLLLQQRSSASSSTRPASRGAP